MGKLSFFWCNFSFVTQTRLCNINVLLYHVLNLRAVCYTLSSILLSFFLLWMKYLDVSFTSSLMAQL